MLLCPLQNAGASRIIGEKQKGGLTMMLTEVLPETLPDAQAVKGFLTP